ncbi:CHAT domain-containing protein [Methylobacter sp. YRD-M1]|uniref:CHAT domain-containing protein n=1 Tax=Methylobacter sp. YRD-M1 TaxID=2911520 RepID=UPI00227C894A|nr:CHAT domain-containing protein [Methylobacter sp. YRD-M1]WAK00539.1 CHAT domain-containing protein [Methylobacter sp. YRD-M1]
MRWRHLFFWLCLFTDFAFGAANNYTGLISQGQGYLRQGQYHLAQDALLAARQIAVTPAQQATADGTLGLVLYRMRHFQRAEELLRKAVDSDVGEPRERARWLATLADLRAGVDATEEAGRLYAEALRLSGDDKKLKLGIRLGQARLMPAEQRLKELNSIHDDIAAIPAHEDRAALLINLAGQAKGLHETGLPLAYNSLEQARRDAVHQPRLLAEALGELARLYEDQQRTNDALSLYHQAIQAAEGINAHDLLLELEWRQGLLYQRQQQPAEALTAYQKAVDHIEAIRQDIPVEYHNGRSSFRETLAPIYMRLADLLLVDASQASGEEKTRLLRRVRDTVELIKQTELEDFLGERCSVQSARTALLDKVAANTAVIYPIILPDRLELLVSTGSEIRQYTQPVDADTLMVRSRRLADSLRNASDDVKVHAGKLYDWLIAPIEPELRGNQVQTLVIVPDGALRLIPMAALYDGKQYLVEQYALASSAGLTLFNPSPLAKGTPKTLLAAMSEPGPVVSDLPPLVMEGVIRNDERGFVAEEAARSRALPVGKADEMQMRKVRSIYIERLERDPQFRSNVKKQLSLPGVVKEVDVMSKRLPHTLLMNSTFTVDGFVQQVTREPYSVVHIASHGIFGGTADTSFIMAYDGIISIDDLDRLLRSDRFKQQPMELLTLSACQTAEGDDRAPLGLSGAALKANVRSALGSLWPVDDEAAAQFMPEFYQALLQPGMSKAQALRQAQLSLMQDKQYEHPYFWAPFILVGNWL